MLGVLACVLAVIGQSCIELSLAHMLLTFAITVVGLPEPTCVVCNQAQLLHACTSSFACLLRAAGYLVASAAAVVLFALCLCMLGCSCACDSGMHACSRSRHFVLQLQRSHKGHSRGHAHRHRARLVWCGASGLQASLGSNNQLKEDSNVCLWSKGNAF
jgi:hypothetical protein